MKHARQFESGVLDRAGQLGFRIVALVIAIAAKSALARDTHHEITVCLEHPAHFREQRLRSLQVLEHVIEYRAVEFAVVERQPVGLHQLYFESLALAEGDGFGIYVDPDRAATISQHVADAATDVEHRAAQIPANSGVQPETAIPDGGTLAPN